jgi:hypothetical protein
MAWQLVREEGSFGGPRIARQRLSELRLNLVLGRTPPQYAGPLDKDATLELLRATKDERFCWQEFNEVWW